MGSFKMNALAGSWMIPPCIMGISTSFLAHLVKTANSQLVPGVICWPAGQIRDNYRPSWLVSPVIFAIRGTIPIMPIGRNSTTADCKQEAADNYDQQRRPPIRIPSAFLLSHGVPPVVIHFLTAALTCLKILAHDAEIALQQPGPASLGKKVSTAFSVSSSQF
jgi:hypothetical protein